MYFLGQKNRAFDELTYAFNTYVTLSVARSNPEYFAWKENALPG